MSKPGGKNVMNYRGFNPKASGKIKV
jgi:hypothetical protein